MTPPKLSVDAQGRVHGANVTWNDPFPTKSGVPGGMNVPHNVLGLVMHTQVGNNPGTVKEFNDQTIRPRKSAHFCIAQDGSVVQMGSVLGWKSWAQADGNTQYYSAEFADDAQDPPPALTQAQINAAAQLLEVLSRDSVGRFPMQLSDRPGDQGFGWHGMGKDAWGSHPHCPGDTRKAQRAGIIELAKTIRTGADIEVFTCDGHKSLHALGAQLHNAVATILQLTAEHSPGAVFTGRMADYLNGVFAADQEKVPEGVTVYHPAPFHSHGTQTLQGLALAFNTQPSAIVRLTAENSPGAEFGSDMAKYLDDVFARSTTLVPPGIHLSYEK
jgi:hypothetical protein